MFLFCYEYADPESYIFVHFNAVERKPVRCYETANVIEDWRLRVILFFPRLTPSDSTTGYVVFFHH